MTNTSSRLRVLIAVEHSEVLVGVRTLLKGDPAIETIAEAQDGETALRMAIELHPAVVVLDLSLPGLNGAEVTRQLLAQLPNCKVVVLTVHEERAHWRGLIEVGAVGYVLTRSAAKDLSRAIRAVASGGLYLDPFIAPLLVDRTPEPFTAERESTSASTNWKCCG